MSSVYKNLSDEDLKIEKDSLKNLEKKIQAPDVHRALRIAVIGAFLLSLVSVASSVYLYERLQKEKRQREALEASEVQIHEKADAFEQSLKRSEAEVARLNAQIKTDTAARQGIYKDLEESRKEVNSLREKLKEAEAKTSAINEQTEEAQTVLDSKPVGPPLPIVSSEKKIEAKGAALAKPAAPAPAPAQPAAIKTAQVLSINRKFNFIVVNLGLKDHLKVGDNLNILRDSKTIGTASIEKIYDNFAAATLTQEPKDAPVREGDSVSKA